MFDALPDPCPFCRRKMQDGRKVRSYEQHKRNFSMMEMAFKAWPVTHQRQFANEEECRKFLQMKAGWFEEANRMPVTGARPEVLIMMAEAMFSAAGNFAIATQQGSDVVVYKPRSISYASLGRERAGEIFDKVSYVIEAEVGISGDEHLNRSLEVA